MVIWLKMSKDDSSQRTTNPLLLQAGLGLWLAVVTFFFSNFQARAEALRVARKEKVEIIKSFSEDADTALTLILNLHYRRSRAIKPPSDDAFKRTRDQYYTEYWSFVQEYRNKPKIFGLVTRVRSSFRSKDVQDSASQLRSSMQTLETPPYPDEKKIVALQKVGTELIAKTVEAMGKEVDSDPSVPGIWSFF